jgi:hypothetical protein
MEYHSAIPGQFGDFFHREYYSGFVIGPHDADNSGLIGDGVFDIFDVQLAFPVHWDFGDLVTEFA